MAEIGDVLTRRKGGDGPARIRLVGVSAAGFVAEPLDSFGSPFTLSADELVSGYGVKAPALPPNEETIMRRADGAATVRAARAYGKRYARPSHPTEPHRDSPEGKFRAAAEAD